MRENMMLQPAHLCVYLTWNGDAICGQGYPKMFQPTFHNLYQVNVNEIDPAF
uniref:Uncharacterized protein n=1 Tax=Arundo donax TaxID=35708 RepID=A0A0A8Z204_ARUDO